VTVDVYTGLRDGEAFCQKIITKDGDFPLKLKIIDADFLDRGRNDNRTKKGIELDKHERPLSK